MAEARIVAVLLTDVVSSTQHLTHLGDEAGNEQRVRHFELLRGCLDLHSGHEVKNTGDGILAVFPSAVDAVQCATAMQQVVDHDRQLHPADGVQMKIGLHIGEPVQDEEDFFGAPMVLVTRLCSAAAPGQIVASDLLRTLVASKHRLDFESIGQLQLKGLDHPVSAYSVPWCPTTASSGSHDGTTDTYLSPLARPHVRSRFVDRVQERATIARWLDVASDGRRMLGLVAGEAGVGKTRLVAESVAAAHEAGAIVLWGRCFEESFVPHGPFVEALRSVFDQACARGELPEVEVSARRLCAIAPTFAPSCEDVASPDGSGRDQRNADPRTHDQRTHEQGADRLRFFDAVDAVLSDLCSIAPVVIVLDDLQWADDGTLLLLTHLVRSPAADRLLVLGTYRDNEVDRGRPLATALADLRRERRYERIRLRGLSDDAVTELVGALTTLEFDAHVVEAISEQTDGNPFFVEEIVSHLVETGVTDDVGLPEGVREVIGRRLSRLSEAANAALTIGAVIGREFSLRTLEPVSGFERDELVDALDEAIDAGLVIEVGDVAGRYSFTHGLVRETLDAELSATRRARIHQRVAGQLEQLGTGHGEVGALAELAHHALAAVPLGDHRRAVQHARAAGERALDELAYEQAAELFEAACEALGTAETTAPDEADLDLRAHVLLGSGTAHVLAGNGAVADAVFRRCLVDAEQLADAELQARAALGLGAAIGSGVGFEFGVFNAELAELLTRSLDGLPDGDTALRARVMARLGSAHGFSSTPERGIELCRSAVAMAERLDDDVTLANCLNDLRSAAWNRIDRNEQEALGERIVELAVSTGEPLIELQGRVWLVCDALERGRDAEEVDAVFAELESLVARLRLPQYCWYVDLYSGLRSLLDGDLDTAVTATERALSVGSAMGDTNVELAYGAATYLQWIERGWFAEMAPIAEEQAARFPALLAWRAVLAQSLAASGERDRAHELLDSTLADVESAAIDPLRPTTLALLIDTAARLGAVEAAGQLYRMLLPDDGRQVMIAQMVGSLGAVSHHLGVAAATAGDVPRALGHFDAAIDQHRRLRAPLWQARSVAARDALLDAHREDAAADLAA